ncbi:MAG: hypothetical protein HYY16_08830 [Planctomycetes bacterium]|nr:hypothetical protein [Planctomycetota bacterium]
MKTFCLALAGTLALFGCGRKPVPPTPYGETPAWRAWRASLLPIPAADFAIRINGSIDFDLGDRPCKPEDWIEISHNGDLFGRRYLYAPPGTAPRVLRTEIRFMPGPVNRISFFDTVTDRAYTFMVDTRTMDGQAADFLFTPGGPEGFTYTQTGR